MLDPDDDLYLVGSGLVSTLFIEVQGDLLLLPLCRLVVSVPADPDGLLVPLEDGLDLSLLVGEPLVLQVSLAFGASDLGGALECHLLPVRVIVFGQDPLPVILGGAPQREEQGMQLLPIDSPADFLDVPVVNMGKMSLFESD